MPSVSAHDRVFRAFGIERIAREHDGLTLSARLEQALGGTIVRAFIDNRGAEPIRLTSAIFEVETVFALSAPARFFKHGYQSWSASGGYDVGARKFIRATPLISSRASIIRASRLGRPNSPKRRPPNFSPSSRAALQANACSPDSSAPRLLFRRSPFRVLKNSRALNPRRCDARAGRASRTRSAFHRGGR